MMHYLLSLTLSAQVGAALPPDVNRLRSTAVRAEARFERLARSLAPRSLGGFDGRNCDEIVGRFCLRFDSTSATPPAVEADPVLDARSEAVEAVRRYFSAAPGDRRAAGPVVRLLIADGRESEALSAATAFAALSPDTLWGHLLVGLAAHAAGATSQAEREFVHALSRMEDDVRREWADPRWLLDPREAGRVRRLDPAQRADYERRFWLVSDPLWLTAANERWIEHMARHTEARLLSEVPRVAGMTRWGRDMDELTVRYGTPTSRRQIRGNHPWDPSSFVEYFDTAQRAYTPERWMMDGFPEQQPPGDPPLIYSSRARSGYELKTVHRVLHLPHQLTRFIAGGEIVLRIDGAVSRPDSVPDDARPRVGLFAYDSAFTRRAEQVTTAAWASDTLRFSLSVRAPPGRSIYSVEVFDSTARFAARSRYAVEADIPGDGVVVSDLLINESFEDGRLPASRTDGLLRPLHSLEVPAGSTLGVFAEVYRRDAAESTPMRVEFALEPAEAPGVFRQFARWLGRATGLAGEQSDPRVAWTAEIEPGVHPISVNVPLDPRRTGRQLLILRVTDAATQTTTETRRQLLIR